jgi:hypothetical protein
VKGKIEESEFFLAVCLNVRVAMNSRNLSNGDGR